MPSILFYLLATIIVVSSLLMITRRHPLPAAFSLVVSFIALAGLYAMLSAPLLAILQVLVYAGAIMALVVFVIMLLNVTDADLPVEPKMLMNVGLALALMAPVFAILFGAIRRFPTTGAENVGPELPAGFGGIEAVGLILFNKYGFPFEVVSILLTVAVVGVVVLAKRRI